MFATVESHRRSSSNIYILSIGLIAASAAAEVPPPGSVSVQSLTYQGAGCPANTVAYDLAPDGKAFTLLYDNFSVDTSESSADKQRKSCDVRLKLNKPDGWQFAFFCFDTRGYAYLDPGVSGTQSSLFSFHSAAPQELGRMTKLGPFDDSYDHRTLLRPEEVTYANCRSQEDLIIRTNIEVERPSNILSKVIHCSSSQGRRGTCETDVPILNVTVNRKHSSAPCDLGRSFGIEGSRIWVQHGCRADFNVRFRGLAGEDAQGLMTVDTFDGHLKQHYGITWRRCEARSRTQMLHCSSSQGRIGNCAASGPIASARLVTKHSAAPCSEGRNWGYRGSTLWVNHGCRADFEVTLR